MRSVAASALIHEGIYEHLKPMSRIRVNVASSGPPALLDGVVIEHIGNSVIALLDRPYMGEDVITVARDTVATSPIKLGEKEHARALQALGAYDRPLVKKAQVQPDHRNLLERIAQESVGQNLVFQDGVTRPYEQSNYQHLTGWLDSLHTRTRPGEARAWVSPTELVEMLKGWVPQAILDRFLQEVRNLPQTWYAPSLAGQRGTLKKQAITMQRGDAYVRRYLQLHEIIEAPRVQEVARNPGLDSDQKAHQIGEEMKRLISEKAGDQDVDIREVSWGEIEVDVHDIYDVIDMLVDSEAVEREYQQHVAKHASYGDVYIQADLDAGVTPDEVAHRIRQRYPDITWADARRIVSNILEYGEGKWNEVLGGFTPLPETLPPTQAALDKCIASIQAIIADDQGVSPDQAYQISYDNALEFCSGWTKEYIQQQVNLMQSQLRGFTNKTSPKTVKSIQGMLAGYKEGLAQKSRTAPPQQPRQPSDTRPRGTQLGDQRWVPKAKQYLAGDSRDVYILDLLLQGYKLSEIVNNNLLEKKGYPLLGIHGLRRVLYLRIIPAIRQAGGKVASATTDLSLTAAIEQVPPEATRTQEPPTFGDPNVVSTTGVGARLFTQEDAQALAQRKGQIRDALKSLFGDASSKQLDQVMVSLEGRVDWGKPVEEILKAAMPMIESYKQSLSEKKPQAGWKYKEREAFDVETSVDLSLVKTSQEQMPTTPMPTTPAGTNKRWVWNPASGTWEAIDEEQPGTTI